VTFEVSDVDVARGVALNEQELWRDMVRWSGGLVHEQDGLLFVAGPSSYLRVAIRLDEAIDGVETVRRAGSSPTGGSSPLRTTTPASVSARDCCFTTVRSSRRT
jgi:hypothetical protein